MAAALKPAVRRLLLVLALAPVVVASRACLTWDLRSSLGLEISPGSKMDLCFLALAKVRGWEGDWLRVWVLLDMLLLILGFCFGWPKII